MKLSEHCAGKWPTIVARLVGEEFVNTRKHCPCPKGEGADRFRFSDKNGHGNYFCACSDGSSGGFNLLQCVHGWDFKTMAKEIEAVIGKAPKDASGTPVKVGKTYAEVLREQARPATRSRYLESRGLKPSPGLLWHEAVDYYDADGKLTGQYPAMLAPIMRGDTFLTFHVTYLHNGAKAPVDPCRKILPGPPNSGAACPLFPVARELGIAEGVETALAAHALFDVPVWAALNTALLGAWEPPAEVKSVMIFGDSDESLAGHAAAYKLAHRLKMKGLAVDLQFPTATGTDWNDVLTGHLHAGKAA